MITTSLPPSPGTKRKIKRKDDREVGVRELYKEDIGFWEVEQAEKDSRVLSFGSEIKAAQQFAAHFFDMSKRLILLLL